MIFEYAEGGDLSSRMNKNYKDFNWLKKLSTLIYISKGLKKIHKKNMVHRDFHTGNILFKDIFTYSDISYISDMGLCGKVDNVNETNIYGVIPYVAPEVLKGKPYTQAADIYSFGMIMYFIATGKQPFSNRAHDHLLALDICNGKRPEINEPEAPRCYIDLMKECWNTDAVNRPSAIEVDKLINSFYVSYYIKNSGEFQKQFEEAEEFRETNSSFISDDSQSNIHPEAIYTSRLLNPFTKDLNSHKSETLEYIYQVLIISKFFILYL